MSQKRENSPFGSQYFAVDSENVEKPGVGIEDAAAMDGDCSMDSSAVKDLNNSFMSRIRTNVIKVISKIFNSKSQNQNRSLRIQHQQQGSAEVENEDSSGATEQRKRRHSSLSPELSNDSYNVQASKRSRLNVSVEVEEWENKAQSLHSSTPSIKHELKAINQRRPTSNNPDGLFEHEHLFRQTDQHTTPRLSFYERHVEPPLEEFNIFQQRNEQSTQNQCEHEKEDEVFSNTSSNSINLREGVFEDGQKQQDDSRKTGFLGNSHFRKQRTGGSIVDLLFPSHLEKKKSLFSSKNQGSRSSLRSSNIGNMSTFHDGATRYGGASAASTYRHNFPLRMVKTPLSDKVKKPLRTAPVPSAASQTIMRIIDNYSSPLKEAHIVADTLKLHATTNSFRLSERRESQLKENKPMNLRSYKPLQKPMPDLLPILRVKKTTESAGKITGKTVCVVNEAERTERM